MENEEIGMLRKHREHIKINLSKLIEQTKYDELIIECVKTRLLTEVMKDNIERIKAPLHALRSDELKRERHKQLFIKITKRGPDAYQRLKDLFVKLQFEEALSVLNEIGENNDDISFFSITNNKMRNRLTIEEEVKNEQFNLSRLSSECPQLVLCKDFVEPKLKNSVVKSQIIHSNTKVGTYPMKTKNNRGILFMANIIDFPNPERRRNGAEEDAQSLMHLFSEIGFKIFAYTNLTKQQFFNLLNEIIKSEYSRDTECFVLALMTHGDRINEKDLAEFHEGAMADIIDIENCFRHNVSPNLIYKPKILIFPFCRGPSPDYGFHPSKQIKSFGKRNIGYQSIQTDGSGNLPIRHANVSSLSDMIICHASVPGFETHRDPEEGSWYIQKFCELMALHAHDTNFEDIIKMIQRQTGNLRSPSGSLQTGSYTNIGFNKFLFFNPGCWEEE